MKNQNWLLLLLTGFFLLGACSTEELREKKVLVLSKTAGYRHASIEKGIATIEKLGAEHGFTVSSTEDAAQITEEVLQTFSAVVFLNTTGDILDQYQQADLERFIQAGGGFVGVHSAADTEYHWPWYNGLVGAYFESHPKVQKATIEKADTEHPSTETTPNPWERTDEWYNYKAVREDLKVLLWLKENSYEGGNMDGKHPIAWYHDYDGGRAFYTGFGHTLESYDEPEFLEHLLGGINYAIGANELDYSRCTSHRVPEENRFVRNILARNLDEPMELDILPDGRILFVERKGALKLFDPNRETVETIANIPVYIKQEDGLMGIAIDPNYEENHWVYLCYSPIGDIPKQNVSRFVFQDDSLHFSSEKIVIEIPVQRDECCHSAGSLEFDHKGNLWISIGDDTNPFASDGFAPIDERPGRSAWDAQKSSANTNDLRGKILRITPQADGSYTIPEGNLFAEGTPNTRPEIYIMGCRNPFRFSIDSKRDYVYWGDVGPDAGKDVEERGPKGIDEVNRAKGPGFWGWPYSRGNNQAYHDYDFTKEQSGPLFDPLNPINNSPNNTGLTKLPPAQEAMIWYSYDDSEEFPWVRKGGKNPMAGPVFYEDEFTAKDKFPPYFDGKLLIYEWMRGWMFVVKLDTAGNFLRADPFMPSTTFSRPMDMLFGKDGSLYVLEYGGLWFARNLDARLLRIDYIDGNRKPVAKIEADRTIGGAPLTVQFSGAASFDYDKDKLTYEWLVDGEKLESKKDELSHTFDRAGIYRVKLKVTDEEGLSASIVEEIQVGNEPPLVAWTLNGNRSFFWDNRSINYQVNVEDREDGKSSDPDFNRENVLVSFNYINEGADITEVAQGHSANMAQAALARGARLIEASDCKGCHAINKRVNGPSYIEVAKRYKNDEQAIRKIEYQIINGGSGKWGESVMSAHPDITGKQAKEMARYILSLANEKERPRGLALAGNLRTNKHKSGEEQGTYILMASYTDTGNENIQSLIGQEQIMLRHPKVQAESADFQSQLVQTYEGEEHTILTNITNEAYFGYKGLDLTDISKIRFRIYFGENAAGGELEIRSNAPDGKLLGKAPINKLEGMQEGWIDLFPTAGMHDVYFVFKNPEKPNATICAVDWVFFEAKELITAVN